MPFICLFITVCPIYRVNLELCCVILQGCVYVCMRVCLCVYGCVLVCKYMWYQMFDSLLPPYGQQLL